MGMFHKLFGKSEPTSDLSNQQTQTPCTSKEELIERYGGIAIDKQLTFGDIIGNIGWNVDMVKEEINFGPSFVFPIQVLGTISHASQSWLWAWANTKSGLSDNVISQSIQLKKYGEINHIDLLSTSTFDFSKDDLHLIGIIASGMFDSSAYYIADYGQGAMVVTINSDMVDKAFNANPLYHHRILTVFPQLISQFEVNHKQALMHYLIAKGYSISQEENKIEGKKATMTITADFDHSNRLIKIIG